MKKKDEKYESIIRKVKGLLAVAEDNANEDEAQSAFLMAQQLMIKYNIEIKEIEGTSDELVIEKGQGTAYKTLQWYERLLASIISENFRVKNYLSGIRDKGRTKRAIMFLGAEKDVQLAKEMYILAYAALDFYTKRHVETYYSEQEVKRNLKLTNQIKKSYMAGFLVGLKNRFEEQRADLQKEYGLMILTPKEVEDAYASMLEGSRPVKYKAPNISRDLSYEQGYKDGTSIDYTKTTIDKDTVS